MSTKIPPKGKKEPEGFTQVNTLEDLEVPIKEFLEREQDATDAKAAAKESFTAAAESLETIRDRELWRDAGAYTNFEGYIRDRWHGLTKSRASQLISAGMVARKVKEHSLIDVPNEAVGRELVWVVKSDEHGPEVAAKILENLRGQGTPITRETVKDMVADLRGPRKITSTAAIKRLKADVAVLKQAVDMMPPATDQATTDDYQALAKAYRLMADAINAKSKQSKPRASRARKVPSKEIVAIDRGPLDELMATVPEPVHDFDHAILISEADGTQITFDATKGPKSLIFAEHAGENIVVAGGLTRSEVVDLRDDEDWNLPFAGIATKLRMIDKAKQTGYRAATA